MKKDYTLSQKKSVTFEPRNSGEISYFFEENKEKYHEMWIVLTKKKYANPQPVSPHEALTEAIRHGLIDSCTKSINELFILAQNRQDLWCPNLMCLYITLYLFL